jgi:hypothetical protein
VRFLADGNLEYLGRTDDQVKWRGFRIEPGEIETVLMAEPQVSQATVILREDEPGDKRLVAYLVADTEQQIDESLLRTSIKQHLPEYMLPSTFVVLEQMPLTPSGKVARRNLPVPSGKRSLADAGQQPETMLHKNLADIWKTLLNVDQVSIDDDFFDLGGHSLLTIKLMRQIEAVTGEQLTIADIFENPTIRELSLLLPNTDWDLQKLEQDGALVKLWRRITRRSR